MATALAAAKRRRSDAGQSATASSAAPAGASIEPHRWRHPGIEKFLAAHTDDRTRLAELREAAASSNRVVAANAAILLGREGQAEAAEPLIHLIEATDTNPWQRRAATEALGDIRDDTIVAKLERLVDEHGHGPRQQHAPYVPELHADLLDALAQAEYRNSRLSSEHDEPRFAAALASPAPIVQRAALLALACPAAGPLPDDVVRLAAAEDRQVRRSALVAIAARNHPEAIAVLRRGLGDRDVDVRLAAIAGLGLIEPTSPDAKTELKQLTGNSAELTRAAAYEALLDSSDNLDELAAASQDKSWRVRRIAASALVRHDSERSSDIAERLVADGNADVAAQMIKSVEQWSLERAGQVLFKAMEGTAYMPRKLAAEQLARRWPPAKRFEINATADRRGELLADLERDWRSQVGAGLLSQPAQTAATEPNREQLELTAVERLATNDLSVRRRAAEDLRNRFAERPLSATALDRLAELMSRENDSLVWLPMFDVLAVDGREPAIRLAYTALSHPAPEVRRRACEQLAAHPANEHGPSLLVSLDDPDSVVVEAAVKALGRLDSLPDAQPLERLLTNPNHHLRVEVAKALVHAGAKSGVAALERLASDADPQVRRQAAVAMGELPDPSFVADLIHLLDDRPEIRRAALDSLPRVADVELPASKASATASADASDAEHWKEWFRRQTTLR